MQCPPFSARTGPVQPIALRTLLWMLLVPLLLPMLIPTTRGAAEPPPEYRFQVEVLASGMPQPMELEVAPDGRVFFNEFGGALKIWKQDGQVVEAGRLPVFLEQENGFLGFALDPGFATNHWVFLFYSPTNHPGQRLSRFEIRGDRLVVESERVVLSFEEQRIECCHHAGSVEFAPDGNLLISTGDNTHPAGDSDGYAPIDERPGREPWDAQKSASNTHDLRGKILRIKPMPDGSYVIPDGNLFPRDGSAGRPEIFVMGCRNPWRMSVDPLTGFVYWGEVGPDAGGDGPRGSRGYDEINQARRAGNFGWPYFVGSNSPYADVDFATRKIGTRFDPARPENLSPNNTGSKILPPAQPALIYWPYGASREFPMLGEGGRTACAGPVFRFKEQFRATEGFPEFFDGCLLFWDWQRPFLKWARLSPAGDLIGIEPFSARVSVVNSRERIDAIETNGGFVIRRPIDAQFGADGRLYMLDYGETWGVNKDTRLLRISHRWGNLPPIAKGTVAPAGGRAPLTLHLNATASTDPEGGQLAYAWNLHAAPVGSPNAERAAPRRLSTEPSPTLVLETPGNFVLELVVRDGSGATASTSFPVVVGNSPPQPRFLAPAPGDFFSPGEPLAFRVEVQDAEDGNSTANDDLMEGRTTVSAHWRTPDASGEQLHPGLALMKQTDCFNCHAEQSRVVGPPLIEVAQRYRGQPDALAASVQRVIRGSSGVWGEVPMLPHASHTEEQVAQMVRWIFDLKPAASGVSFARGLTGTVVPPADDTLRSATLEVVYSDLGAPPAGSLSGRATLPLRSRRLEAEHADQASGVKPVQRNGASGGRAAGQIDDGSSLGFNNLNLTTASAVTLRVSSPKEGGLVEIRADSPSGRLLGSVEVKPTGAWDRWEEYRVPISGPRSRADVHLVFVNPGKKGFLNVDWVTFEK